MMTASAPTYDMPEYQRDIPVTPEIALELGLWITAVVGGQFYKHNFEMYRRAAIDLEDLVGHLRYYILTARFLKTVETNPTFYSEKSYRKSLYVSCQKACFAHYRKHVRSLKRGLALRPGAMVPIDEEDENGFTAQIAAGPSFTFINPTGNCLIDRATTFLQFGGTWERLKAIIPMLPFQEKMLGSILRTRLQDHAQT